MNQPTPPLSPPPDPATRTPATAVPPRACDCHAHVFGPVARYPITGQSVYTPSPTPYADYRRMLDALGVERSVLVQPSVYGSDNRALLEGMAEAGAAAMRGVAVLPFDTDRGEIERLHGLGVRGLRCNIVDLKTDKGALPLDALKAQARRIAPFGWHLELLMHVDAFPDLDRRFADFPVDLVFGHLGYVPAAQGVETEGFRALVRLMRDGRAWAKLTAPYRLTPDEAPYRRVDPFAQVLVAEAPERLIWGSDWPHIHIKTAMPNDGDLFDLFARWVPDAATRTRILVDNPATLYDF